MRLSARSCVSLTVRPSVRASVRVSACVSTRVHVSPFISASRRSCRLFVGLFVCFVLGSGRVLCRPRSFQPDCMRAGVKHVMLECEASD